MKVSFLDAKNKAGTVHFSAYSVISISSRLKLAFESIVYFINVRAPDIINLGNPVFNLAIYLANFIRLENGLS